MQTTSYQPHPTAISSSGSTPQFPSPLRPNPPVKRNPYPYGPGASSNSALLPSLASTQNSTISRPVLGRSLSNKTQVEYSSIQQMNKYHSHPILPSSGGAGGGIMNGGGISSQGSMSGFMNDPSNRTSIPSFNSTLSTANNQNQYSTQLRGSPMTRRVEQYSNYSPPQNTSDTGAPHGPPLRVGSKVLRSVIRNVHEGRQWAATSEELEQEKALRNRKQEIVWKGDVDTLIGSSTDLRGFSTNQKKCTELWRQDNKPIDTQIASAGFQKCLDLIRQSYEATSRQSYHFRRDYPSGRRPPNLDAVLNKEYIDEDAKMLMPALSLQFRESPSEAEVRSWSVPLVSQCKVLGGKPVKKLDYSGARLIGTRVIQSSQKEIGA